jgi:hypothetical protein
LFRWTCRKIRSIVMTNTARYSFWHALKVLELLDTSKICTDPFHDFDCDIEKSKV